MSPRNDAAMTSDGSPRRRPGRSEKGVVAHIVALVIVPFLRLVGRYRFTGAEKIPRTGSFILAANHYSHLDPLVVAYILWKHGRMPRFLAKESLFRVPVLGFVLRATGQIPVHREAARGNTDPLAAAGNLVERGHAVIIYPEGTLTREPDLWPMRGKTGAIRAALKYDIPVIPVAHWGVQEILPRYAKRLRVFPRRTVHIAIGDPVELSALRGRDLDAATLTEGTALIMTEVTRLLATLRPGPAPLEPWDPVKYGQSNTGRFE